MCLYAAKTSVQVNQRTDKLKIKAIQNTSLAFFYGYCILIVNLNLLIILFWNVVERQSFIENDVCKKSSDAKEHSKENIDVERCLQEISEEETCQNEHNRTEQNQSGA